MEDYCINGSTNSVNVSSSWVLPSKEEEKECQKTKMGVMDIFTNLLYKVNVMLSHNLNFHKTVYLFGNQTHNIEEFKKLWNGIIWFSYRNNFKPIINNKGKPFTSDTGWGCTLRVAQMIYAQALQRTDVSNKKDIIRMFMDDSQSLFSITNITKIGFDKFKVDAGEWYCPSIAVSIISRILKEASISDLKVKIFTDGVIYLDKLSSCLDDGCVFPDKDDIHSSRSMKETSLLIFVTYRLGMKSIDQSYHEPILNLFTAPCCIGFIGGKPDKAFYFVGMNGEKLIYLDPHFVQNYSTVLNEDEYKSNTVNLISIGAINPTLCIGFLIPNKSELNKFIDWLKDIKSKGKHFVDYMEKKPNYSKMEKELEI